MQISKSKKIDELLDDYSQLDSKEKEDDLLCHVLQQGYEVDKKLKRKEKEVRFAGLISIIISFVWGIVSNRMFAGIAYSLFFACFIYIFLKHSAIFLSEKETIAYKVFKIDESK